MKLFLRSKWVRWLLSGVLVLLVYLLWQMWDIRRVGYTDDGSSADVALVLGAAAYPAKPSPVFQARIDHAIALHRQGRVKRIILTGGFGKNAGYAESEVAKNYCLKMGVPESAILLENRSTTTQQNLVEAEKIMRKEGLKTALIVSDPWHLKRALAMARKHHIDAKPSATTTSMYRTDESKLRFLLRELYYIHIWRLE